MMKLAFVTDSGTGFTRQFWQERGIYSLPLQITIGDKTYDEGEDITYDQIIENLHNQIQMKTSLPSLGKIEDLFEYLKKEGYEGVFCVPICKGLSGTLDAMESAANHVGLAFYGFDTYSTAVMEAHCVETAKKMYDQGKSIEEIMAQLEKICGPSDTIVLCDDLQHMKRGGRLTAAAAMLGGLLKIKPLLHENKETGGRVDVFDKVRTMSRAQDRIIDQLKQTGVQLGGLLKIKPLLHENKETGGRVDVFDKVRTMSRAQDRIIDQLKQTGVQGKADISVAHVDSVEAAEKFAHKIKDQFPEATVRVIDLVSAVGIHTGLNALCVQVFDPVDGAVDVYTKENSIEI